MVVLPFFAMFFMVLKGFIYTFVVDFYASVSHLVPFCTAFCTKTPCILHQNALRLAPKRLAFSGKTRCI